MVILRRTCLWTGKGGWAYIYIYKGRLLGALVLTIQESRKF